VVATSAPGPGPSPHGATLQGTARAWAAGGEPPPAWAWGCGVAYDMTPYPFGPMRATRQARHIRALWLDEARRLGVDRGLVRKRLLQGAAQRDQRAALLRVPRGERRVLHLAGGRHVAAGFDEHVGGRGNLAYRRHARVALCQKALERDVVCRAWPWEGSSACA
jgi:hypothetical protein